MALNRLIEVTYRDIDPRLTFDPVLGNSGYADDSTTQWVASADPRALTTHTFNTIAPGLVATLSGAVAVLWRRALSSTPRLYDAETMNAFLATGPQRLYVLKDKNNAVASWAIDRVLDDGTLGFLSGGGFARAGNARLGRYETLAVSDFRSENVTPSNPSPDEPIPNNLGFSWALAQQTLGPPYTLRTWAEVQGLPTSQGLVSVLATGGTLSAFEEVQQVRTARIRHVPGRQPIQFRHDNILWTVSSVAPSRDGRFIDVEGFAKIAGGN